MIGVEQLLNYDFEYLQKYIVGLPDNDYKKNILLDQRIRDVFINNPSAHYPFVYLVQELTEEMMPFFVDGNLIAQLKNGDDSIIRKDDKFNAIMSCGNKAISKCLTNIDFFEYIIKAYNNHIYLSCLDGYFGKALINYVLQNRPKDITILSEFNDVVQAEILDEEIINKILASGISFNFIASLKISALTKLCQDPRFTNIISNMNLTRIDIMISTGVALSKDLQNSKNIINQYVSIESIDNYRFMVDKLCLSNSELYENVIKIKNEKTDSFVSSIDPNDEILPMFMEEQIINSSDYQLIREISIDVTDMSKEEREEYYKLRSKQHIFKLIVNKYFEENGFNFLANLNEMMKYINGVRPEFMSEERYELYLNLLNYKSLSLSQLVDLYNSLNGSIYTEAFYDDYRMIKDLSYAELNSKAIKSSQINENPSYEIEGIRILELKGEPFLSMVHSTNYPVLNPNSTTTSISVIGDSKIGVFNGDGRKIIFGFDAIPEDQIYHVYHSDSHTNHEYGTRRINEIFTPEQMLLKTKKYNEILLSQKARATNDSFDDDRKYVSANYIVAFNQINDSEIEFAKKYNIPILLIYEKYYKVNGESTDMDHNDYSTYHQPSQLR